MSVNWVIGMPKGGFRKIRVLAKRFWLSATSTSDYWLTRFVFLRILGIVYIFGFLSLAHQVVPLVGSNGLLPADNYLDAIGSRFDLKLDAFMEFPTIFWFHLSDTFLSILAWAGVLLSLVVVMGFANVPILFVMWALYFSFVSIGQVWYGYGWEIQLLETGFLAMFVVPLVDPRPFPKFPPPVPVIWLLRWLAFRIYLGSGLIKIRHDLCWQDLTCLVYHYETQPIPNPLSPWFHFMPQWFHKVGVALSHFAQLFVPFLILGPRQIRHFAGIVIVSYQLLLIIGGNYQLLNWITIAPAIALFDDRFLRRFLPGWLTAKADNAAKAAASAKPRKLAQVVPLFLLIVAIWLSLPVISNLLSPGQAMNTSFNRLNLVNTYGAFGSVTKERYELIIQGTASSVITSETVWKEYEFKAKPGNVSRHLPIVAPYQYKIDWQMWFAAMQRSEHNPWLINLVWKLLHNDKSTLSLLAYNPFQNEPPKYIRIEFYRYKFLPPARTSNETAIWNRTRIGTWLVPLSKDTPRFKELIAANRWDTYD